jgi:hypothetical protein
MKVDLFQALTMLFFFFLQAEVSFGDVIQPLFSKKSAAEKAWGCSPTRVPSSHAHAEGSCAMK